MGKAGREGVTITEEVGVTLGGGGEGVGGVGLTITKGVSGTGVGGRTGKGGVTTTETHGSTGELCDKLIFRVLGLQVSSVCWLICALSGVVCEHG